MSNNKMEEKEIWTKKVLQSLEGMNRAEPRGDLFDDISLKIQEITPVKIIKIKELKWIAAAAVLLVFINTYSIFNQFSKADETWQNETSELSIITKFSLYNE